MLDSIKNWLNRSDRHQADRQRLEAEAKDFRLPGETLPQVFKYLFFTGLGFLNYRLFSHAVPGLWGQATGVVAVMAEAIALYAAHNFSRSAGAFRLALGSSGVTLMAFSLVHGTFSILDLIGAADVSAAVTYYSRVVAFPLLAGLLGVSVVAITMTHPRNIIRLKQAMAHTAVAIGRAKVASELELMRAQSALDQARLDRQRERTRREQDTWLKSKSSSGSKSARRRWSRRSPIRRCAKSWRENSELTCSRNPRHARAERAAATERGARNRAPTCWTERAGGRRQRTGEGERANASFPAGAN